MSKHRCSKLFGGRSIAQATSAAEQQARYVAGAFAARQQMLESGKGFDVDEVHAYLIARIANRNATKPNAESWQ